MGSGVVGVVATQMHVAVASGVLIGRRLWFLGANPDGASCEEFVSIVRLQSTEVCTLQLSAPVSLLLLSVDSSNLLSLSCTTCKSCCWVLL